MKRDCACREWSGLHHLLQATRTARQEALLVQPESFGRELQNRRTTPKTSCGTVAVRRASCTTSLRRYRVSLRHRCGGCAIRCSSHSFLCFSAPSGFPCVHACAAPAAREVEPDSNIHVARHPKLPLASHGSFSSVCSKLAPKSSTCGPTSASRSRPLHMSPCNI